MHERIELRVDVYASETGERLNVAIMHERIELAKAAYSRDVTNEPRDGDGKWTSGSHVSGERAALNNYVDPQGREFRANWSYRKNGKLDALMTAGPKAAPFVAEMQQVGKKTYDLDLSDPEQKMASQIEKVVGEAPYEFTFKNIRTEFAEKPNAFGVTGTGNAREVIAKAQQCLVEFVNSYHKPKVIYYSSHQKSRTGLYDLLTRRIGSVSDCTGYRLEIPGSEAAWFAIVRNESKAAFEAVAKKNKISAISYETRRAMSYSKTSNERMNADGETSEDGKCPDCGSADVDHCRTDGSANARCNDCGKVFSDKSYGRPLIVDFERGVEMNEKYSRIEIARVMSGAGSQPMRYAGQFDESKHPRGQPHNAGQFAHEASGKAFEASKKLLNHGPRSNIATHEEVVSHALRTGKHSNATNAHERMAKVHREIARTHGLPEHEKAAALHEAAATAHIGAHFIGEPSNPQGTDSASRNMTPDAPTDPNEWTPEHFSPERRKLHEAIINHHFRDVTPVPNPEAHMMGGGPASGKSVAIQSGHIKIPDNHVGIDADAIKGMLPEYTQMVASKDEKAAAFAHEESSYLSKQIMDKASQGKYHLMLDGTGDSGLKSLAGKIQRMRAGGHRILGHYVTVDTETALQRNRERAVKTGRLPPEKMVKDCHAMISKILPDAVKSGLFDEFQLFDTNGDGAKRIASAKGNQLQIRDGGLWGRFLEKANGS